MILPRLQGKQKSAESSLLRFALLSFGVCPSVCLSASIFLPLWFILCCIFISSELSPHPFPLLNDDSATVKLIAKCTSHALIWKRSLIPSSEGRQAVTEDSPDWGNLIFQCKVANKQAWTVNSSWHHQRTLKPRRSVRLMLTDTDGLFLGY